MKAPPLQKLSLTIDPESEEPVAALLESLFGRPPVIHLNLKTNRTTISLFLEKHEEADAPLLARLREGLSVIRESGLSTGAARIRRTIVEGEDWAESWKRHFKPFEIGRALLVKPSWSRRRARKNQKVIVLDPGLSFGTGQHPTTRFCLEALVRCRGDGTPQSFLDMGTGTGILAIAAAKLGYRPVEAFDFDPACVRVAKANARLNGASANLQIRTRNVLDLPARSRARYDVIAANLTDDILRDNRDKILHRLKPHGSLVLAGILHRQFAAVRRSFEEAGTKLASWKCEQEWKSGVFTF